MHISEMVLPALMAIVSIYVLADMIVDTVIEIRKGK